MFPTTTIKTAFTLSARSIKNLADVNPYLIRIVGLAITLSEIDFVVIEGRRSAARQHELFLAGKSRTLNSKHLTGDAVDLAAFVNGEVSWDAKLYFKIAAAMKEAAHRLGYGEKLVWGGEFKGFFDGPHFQIGN